MRQKREFKKIARYKQKKKTLFVFKKKYKKIKYKKYINVLPFAGQKMRTIPAFTGKEMIMSTNISFKMSLCIFSYMI